MHVCMYVHTHIHVCTIRKNLWLFVWCMRCKPSGSVQLSLEGDSYIHTYIHSIQERRCRTQAEHCLAILIHIHTYIHTCIHACIHTQYPRKKMPRAGRALLGPFHPMHARPSTNSHTKSLSYWHTGIYIYIYIYICMYVYTCVHVYVYTPCHKFTHKIPELLAHTYLYMYMHMGIHSHTHTHIYVNAAYAEMHMSAENKICKYTRTYVHTRIHTYIYAHTYIRRDLGASLGATRRYTPDILECG